MQAVWGRRARPASREVGDAIFAAFLLTEFCDGALTYLGVHTFGPAIEANPIVAWSITAAGVGTGLFAAKTFAVTCGMLLHLLARHSTIAFLTIIHLVFAVWPWAGLLASAMS